jgi:hypothetical protein
VFYPRPKFRKLHLSPRVLASSSSCASSRILYQRQRSPAVQSHCRGVAQLPAGDAPRCRTCRPPKPAGRRQQKFLGAGAGAGMAVPLLGLSLSDANRGNMRLESREGVGQPVHGPSLRRLHGPTAYTHSFS